MKKYLFSVIAIIMLSQIAFAQSSLTFNGFFGFVTLANNASLQATNSLTVEAWINATTWQLSLEKGTIVSNSNDNSGFNLQAGENGKVQFSINIDNVWYIVETDEILSEGNWYHLVGIYDGASLKIFVNGIEKASEPASGTITTFEANMQVGGNPTYSARIFNGKIDEIRVWKTARTKAQIKEFIQTSLLGNEENLALYWKFDEGADLTAFDSSSNGNDGTLTYLNSPDCWGENYISPLENLDVSVTQIISPISGEQLSANEEVTVRIWNYSINDVSNFAVQYQINGNNAIEETVTQTISGLNYLDYTFTQNADLSVVGDYYFEASTNLTGDVNSENNLFTKQITNFALNTDYSLSFDGIDDKVVIADNPLLNPTTAITIEAWIKADTWASQVWQGSIVSKDADGGSGESGYVLRAGNNGSLSFCISPNWTEVVSDKIMYEGRWYHVAGVFDGSEMRIYINGILQGSKSATSEIVASDVDLMIGECSGFSGRLFNGNIDEVRIWNTARTQQELIDNMTVELNGDEFGLVAYYNFNDGINSEILSDLTANNFEGTLTNMNFETSWQYGYELTNNDIGVKSVLNPGNSGNLSSAERLIVEIQNYGFNDVSNFPITYEFRGETVTEIVTETLPAFETLEYTFNTFIDADIETPKILKIYTDFQDDIFSENDTIETTIEKSNTIRIFDQVQHNFAEAGQTHYSTVVFPPNLDEYSTILMHISLNCPSTGCDPWDQYGKISLTKDGHIYEIGRFVTPYGVACGPWTIDITDFKSLLTGKCDFTSYIQVWGGSGWLLDVDIELVEGQSEYTYSDVIPLWETDYLVYGDPNISYDLPEQTFFINENIEKSVVRMTNTGHGQANTDNAAEFSNKTHNLNVNNSVNYPHNLWKSDCDVNTCSPQSGTWTYARAGWCPGQEVTPAWFNITNNLTLNSDNTIDYVLEDYTNYLNTGYNGSSHTEPHYKIHSFLINYSNEPFSDFSDIELTSISSPENENIFPTSNETVSVTISNNGTQTITDYEVGYYVNNENFVIEAGTEEIPVGGSVDFTFSQTVDLAAFEYAELVAFVNISNDANPANDAKRIWTGTEPIVSTELIDNQKLIIYPNPTINNVHVIFKNGEEISNYQIYDNLGRILKSDNFTNQTDIDFSNLPVGIYFIKVKNDNKIITKKIVKQ